VIDIVLNHNRYSLLDQSADSLIDYVRQAGLAYINAAPYSSGILAKPASAKPRYSYGHPTDAITEQTARYRALCEDYEVDLAAVALQFSTRDQRITSTVVGVSHPDRVRALIANIAAEIPKELWAGVERLIAAAHQ
jgi:D-threo-aldose 1-dehydrogenase